MADRTPEEIAKGLTKAQRAGVLWFAENGLTAWFPSSAPQRAVRSRLLAAEILKRSAVVERGMPMAALGLTDLGRAVAAILRGEKADG